MLGMNVKIIGLDATRSFVAGIEKQIRYAASRALTSLAFKANAEIKQQMRDRFKGGATRYSLAAFKIDRARPDNLTAIVSLRTDSPGKGREYDKALGHLFTGGDRRWKRMEGAFRNIGVLPGGHMMAVPRDVSWANPLDNFGNPKPSLIVKLIAYFNAFGEQGYRANMTDKRRERLAKKSGNKIGGVVYFISRGKGMWYGRQQHLAAGIWAKRGTHGVDIAPVFLFVKKGSYRQVIDLSSIGESTVIRHWKPEFDRELVTAIRNSK